MASIQTSARIAERQVPPVVRNLEAVFAALPDDELLSALIGPVRRGPKGHSTVALWHAFVAKYLLGLASTDALIRALHDNPYLADVCGFTTIPHKSTFSRFYARLASPEFLPLVQVIFERMVRQRMATIPGFGKRVAIDSTTLKGWANGAKAKKVDPDAGWSVKGGTQGVKEMVFGYKLHLLLDTESELPISAVVTAGNRSDTTHLPIVLEEARRIATQWKPDAVMGDKGYDAATNYAFIYDQMGAVPIIPLNQRRTEKGGRVPKRSALHLRFLDLRKHGVFARESVQWKALYSQRGAVERAFSRLKGQRALNKITVRRMAKVTVHCYLSLIAMQASHSLSVQGIQT